jgi:4'-phosphopantetheinyl transferase
MSRRYLDRWHPERVAMDRTMDEEPVDRPFDGRATEYEIPAPGSLAAPVGEHLQVWWAPVAVGRLADGLRAALAADLNPATLARIDRYHRVEDRDRGLAAHSLLRRLLAAVTGGTPSELTLRTRCGGCGQTDHGKPYLDIGTDEPPVEVNLSHSAEVVCVALAAPGVHVGVDVERRRTMDWEKLRRSVFADVEWATAEESSDPAAVRMQAWARKESAVKSGGHGLTLPMRAVVIQDAGWGGWSARLPAEAGAAAGWDLDLQPQVAAAVAVHRSGEPRPPEPPTVHRVELRSGSAE